MSYKEYDKETLGKLRRIGIMILKEMIPLDDDIDSTMLRKDYEKIIDVASNTKDYFDI